jgi:hypothetical protein
VTFTVTVSTDIVPLTAAGTVSVAFETVTDAGEVGITVLIALLLSDSPFCT